MDSPVSYSPLFLIGVGLMIAAAVAAVIACVLLRISGRRLKKRLDEEYGKKRV